jgi:hypothetical protein
VVPPAVWNVTWALFRLAVCAVTLAASAPTSGCSPAPVPAHPLNTSNNPSSAFRIGGG